MAESEVITEERAAPETIPVEEHAVKMDELRKQIDNMSQETKLIGPDGNFKDGWTELLPEDLRDDPITKKFTNLGGMVKSHRNLEGMMGKSTIPDDSWDEDQKAEFYEKLGVPQVRDAYPSVERPEGLDERIPFDEGMVTSFMDQAHKARMTPENAKGMVEWFYQQQQAQLEQQLEEQEQETAATVAGLREEIGDKGLMMARKGAQHLTDKIGVDVMADPVAANNPAVIKMLNFVASEYIGEKVLPKLADELSMQDAESTITDVMNNPNNPYYKGYRGQDTPTRNDKAQAYMQRMFDRKNRET